MNTFKHFYFVWSTLVLYILNIILEQFSCNISKSIGIFMCHEEKFAPQEFLKWLATMQKTSPYKNSCMDSRNNVVDAVSINGPCLKDRSHEIGHIF